MCCLICSELLGTTSKPIDETIASFVWGWGKFQNVVETKIQHSKELLNIEKWLLCCWGCFVRKHEDVTMISVRGKVCDLFEKIGFLKMTDF